MVRKGILWDGPVQAKTGTVQLQDRLLARIMDVWQDPDRLTREITASQEARLLIRNASGDAALF